MLTKPCSFQIDEVVELTLFANQKRSELRPPLVWNTLSEASTQQSMSKFGGPVIANLLVELKPMEIRTFRIELDD